MSEIKESNSAKEKKSSFSPLGCLILIVLLIWFPIRLVSRHFVADPRPEPIVLTSLNNFSEIRNNSKTATIIFDYSQCTFCQIRLNGERGKVLSKLKHEKSGSISPVEFYAAEGKAYANLLNRMKEGNYYRIQFLDPYEKADYQIRVNVEAFATDGGRFPHSYAEAVWKSKDYEGLIMEGTIDVLETATDSIVATYRINRVRGHHRDTYRGRNDSSFEEDFDNLYKEFNMKFDRLLWWHTTN